jgi:mannose-6-phosphate isomerase-like protein (cupin superfamily)
VSNYSIRKLEDVPDFLGDYPGEMRFFTGELGNEQVALTHRRMPAKTGGKGSYGHRHKTQEEVYFVVDGTLQFKLEDDVIDVGPGTAVRVAPEVVRSVWNEGPEDANLIIISVRVESVRDDAEMIADFWPE